MRASADRPPERASTPVTSMSSPVPVVVTCRVGADFGCSRKGAASLRSPGRAAVMAGSRTIQSEISTRFQDLRALKPSRAIRRLSPRRACRAVRRRVAGAVRTTGRISASRRSRARVDLSRSTFQARAAESSQCCRAQPPQAPKYRQGGGRRSALGDSMASSTGPSRPARSRTTSPGRMPGTWSSRPSAKRMTPSPSPPTESTVRAPSGGGGADGGGLRGGTKPP